MPSLCTFQHGLQGKGFFSCLKSTITNYTFKKKNYFLWPNNATPFSITALTSCKLKVCILPASLHQQNLSTSVSRKQSIYLTNHKTIFYDVKKLLTLPVCQSICNYDDSSNKYSRAWGKNKSKFVPHANPSEIA